MGLGRVSSHAIGPYNMLLVQLVGFKRHVLGSIRMRNWAMYWTLLWLEIPKYRGLSWWFSRDQRRRVEKPRIDALVLVVG